MNMMNRICACGAALSEDNRFCGKCGRPVPAFVPTPQSNVCSCGAALEEDAAFCPSCGKRTGNIPAQTSNRNASTNSSLGAGHYLEALKSKVADSVGPTAGSAAINPMHDYIGIALDVAIILFLFLPWFTVNALIAEKSFSVLEISDLARSLSSYSSGSASHDLTFYSIFICFSFIISLVFLGADIFLRATHKYNDPSAPVVPLFLCLFSYGGLIIGLGKLSSAVSGTPWFWLCLLTSIGALIFATITRKPKEMRKQLFNSILKK